MQINLIVSIFAVVRMPSVCEDLDEKNVGEKETQDLSGGVVGEVVEVFRIMYSLDEKNIIL